MFTGLITQLGLIRACRQHTPLLFILRIKADCTGFKLGDSIACDGVCLTVANLNSSNEIEFHLSPETLSKTHFSIDSEGHHCHLEAALKIGDRLGGHFVTGHVDGLAQIQNIEPIDACQSLSLKYLDAHTTPIWHEKGSITVDGVSLTLNRIEGLCFEVMLIPHTLKHTHFNTAQSGQHVHIEFDLIGKTVAQQLQTHLKGFKK